MNDQDNKEVKPVVPEMPVGGVEKAEALVESQELNEGPIEDAHAVREQIEAIKLSTEDEANVRQSAQAIPSDDQKGKITHLLELARTKGVVYAIHAAKKLNDAHVLDALHDKLVEEGLYKNFKV